ncbi:VP1 protein [Calomys tener polyomavirus]|uniref:VP1 protein n=1 Tax=Akodon montensis polyomavirus TaxID=2163422 RepID=UPI000E298AA0|nr:VP1 protein [Akodon montensis polyomavirus]AVY05546.1 VP1 protein [Akodon montensis polyomavirus]AVY05551.1 VP1 protein [Calomys tener polyomavirus]
MACQTQGRKRLGPGKAPKVAEQRLPRILRKGGVEVLGTVPLSEHTQYRVECIVKPVFGNEPSNPPNYWNHSSALSGSALTDGELHLCYSLMEVQLPEISEQCFEDAMIVWECFRMETELLMTPKITVGGVNSSGGINSVQGTQMYFWAVGGSPLDVMYLLPKENMRPRGNLTAFDSGHSVYDIGVQKGQVVNETFPVEYWVADPSKNDNCRYFGRVVGGAATPPVITYSNSSTIPLLDENGLGIMCNNGRCYITCADITGYLANRVESSHGRFFRLHFRQRRIKNPYTMNLLYKQVFQSNATAVEAQKEVVEVTTVEDESGLPMQVSNPRCGQYTPIQQQQASPLYNVQG